MGNSFKQRLFGGLLLSCCLVVVIASHQQQHPTRDDDVSSHGYFFARRDELPGANSTHKHSSDYTAIPKETKPVLASETLVAHSAVDWHLSDFSGGHSNQSILSDSGPNWQSSATPQDVKENQKPIIEDDDPCVAFGASASTPSVSGTTGGERIGDGKAPVAIPTTADSIQPDNAMYQHLKSHPGVIFIFLGWGILWTKCKLYPQLTLLKHASLQLYKRGRKRRRNRRHRNPQNRPRRYPRQYY
ncbi:unnamed protein product [Cylindrotheca closterium]|uniref:Uncharacterized protein n=1 Tax=Cylindrotheca closterium TaxID=2856 RepID=A0AAD2G134_9STRA|nr:unnamed protein product [Cylindrotheca closterium]